MQLRNRKRSPDRRAVNRPNPIALHPYLWGQTKSALLPTHHPNERVSTLQTCTSSTYAANHRPKIETILHSV